MTVKEKVAKALASVSLKMAKASGISVRSFLAEGAGGSQEDDEQEVVVF